MLGRIIEIDGEDITLKGDPRRLEVLKEYFGTGKATKVLPKNGFDDGAPGGGWQRHDDDDDDDDDGLTATDPKKCSMLAARLNYMGQDNPMIQLPAKEVCKHMPNRKAYDFINIMRVVRFMIGIGEVGLELEWQDENDSKQAKVHIDNDWAGCKITRKSASGAVLKAERHIIKT